MTTQDPAPDFRGTYPSAGAQIGPAWQMVWDLLAERQWVKGVEIARNIADRTGLADATIRSLLRQAAQAGKVETELRFAGKVDGYRAGRKPIRAAWYRRP